MLFGLLSLHWARRHHYEVLTWRVGKCYCSFVHILNVLIFNSKRRIYFHYTSVSSYGVIAWSIQPSKNHNKSVEDVGEVTLTMDSSHTIHLVPEHVTIFCLTHITKCNNCISPSNSTQALFPTQKLYMMLTCRMKFTSCYYQSQTRWYSQPTFFQLAIYSQKEKLKSALESSGFQEFQYDQNLRKITIVLHVVELSSQICERMFKTFYFHL